MWNMIIQVLVQLSSQNIDRTFDYHVPLSLEEQIKIGIRVQVPFGSQVLEGFVLKIKEKGEEGRELKDIFAIVDSEVVLNEELLCLGKWMREKTLATLISCYQAMLPKALKAKHGTVIHKKYDVYLRLDVTKKAILDGKWNATQEEILKEFLNREIIKKEELNLISTSSVKTLLKKGILKEEAKELYRYQKDYTLKEKYPLTVEQQQVVDEVLEKAGTSKTFLLHGVTGSGKTEVYMELIEAVLKKGKTSIVLVPEISLTPQIVDRFQSRFAGRVAVLHSRLSDGEKYDEWRKIVREEVQIVIGARSAIFAPLKNIGMIIIDEEHSNTYKQENHPKYHALDVAIERSKTHNCPVVLGSATPSLESFARASRGVYQLLNLPHRVNQRELPKVILVDMNEEIKKGNQTFSSSLLQEIEERLAKKEQIILLLNRRGYASFITCQNCGYVEKCPNCDITLTYHKTSNTLRCHYCGYGTKKNTVCSECGETAMNDLGCGTQRVEEELNNLFPNSRILRMDLDTTSKKGSHEKMIEDFQKGNYDILLGTQMIAKGLDFPNVTLVGVINADTSLHIPDFRSSEYTFQLLSQVSGRSGRGKKEGKVIIQTFNQTHYAINLAKDHQYLKFYEAEMQIRRQLKYPPYYYLVYIRIMGKDYDEVGKASNQVGNYLRSHLSNMIILGPSVCNVFRIKNIYRFGIILKYKKEENLYPVLKVLLDHYKNNNKIQVDVDFNPNHF